MWVSIVMLMQGSKYFIVMQEICLVEVIPKVHVCILKKQSLDSLIVYFQIIHDIFGLKGGHIKNVQCMLSQNSVNKATDFNLSCLQSIIPDYPILNGAVQ